MTAPGRRTGDQASTHQATTAHASETSQGNTAGVGPTATGHNHGRVSRATTSALTALSKCPASAGLAKRLEIIAAAT
jgi:hypothetical protein